MLLCEASTNHRFGSPNQTGSSDPKERARKLGGGAFK